MHYKFRLFIRNYYIVNGIVNLIKKINHRYDGTIILVDLDDFHDIPRFHISHEDVVIYITKKTVSRAYRQIFNKKICAGFFIDLDMELDEIEEVIKLAMSGKQQIFDDSSGSELNHTELNIISSLSEGLSVMECARIFNLNVKLVSYHKRNAMQKLTFKRNQELVKFINSINNFINKAVFFMEI